MLVPEGVDGIGKEARHLGGLRFGGLSTLIARSAGAAAAMASGFASILGTATGALAPARGAENAATAVAHARTAKTVRAICAGDG